LAVAKNREAARIKVEDARADLLLITTKECGMWNTYDGCVQIMDTLRKHNYPHSYDLIVYENAGEPFLVPYVFPAGESSMKMAPRLVLSMGGTVEGNINALVGAWEKAIEFFGQAKN
jgi:BAAT / Acyl-CoA thioester hydrolase C terminal